MREWLLIGVVVQRAAKNLHDAGDSSPLQSLAKWLPGKTCLRHNSYVSGQ